ncbi:unnamed protein product, partial [Nezara viridula]
MHSRVNVRSVDRGRRRYRRRIVFSLSRTGVMTSKEGLKRKILEEASFPRKKMRTIFFRSTVHGTIERPPASAAQVSLTCRLKDADLEENNADPTIYTTFDASPSYCIVTTLQNSKRLSIYEP